MDATTKMPVLQIELGADVQISDETFWTYDLDRKEAASYPADFFAVAQGLSTNVATWRMLMEFWTAAAHDTELQEHAAALLAALPWATMNRHEQQTGG